MINQNITSTAKHCSYCFDVIESVLLNKDIPIFPIDLPQISAPLFVTWNTRNGDLRGCIGTFDSNPINQNLSQYAQISAFQDSRFNPIQLSELEDLKVSVSILHNFEKNKKYDEWEIGRHGIIIDFIDDKYNYNATFLPNVPVEHKLDQDATLKQLIRKSGYTNNYKNVLQRISLTTYESSKSSIDYIQWQQLKQNQSNNQINQQ